MQKLYYLVIANVSLYMLVQSHQKIFFFLMSQNRTLSLFNSDRHRNYFLSNYFKIEHHLVLNKYTHITLFCSSDVLVILKRLHKLFCEWNMIDKWKSVSFAMTLFLTAHAQRTRAGKTTSSVNAVNDIGSMSFPTNFYYSMFNWLAIFPKNKKEK